MITNFFYIYSMLKLLNCYIINSTNYTVLNWNWKKKGWRNEKKIQSKSMNVTSKKEKRKQIKNTLQWQNEWTHINEINVPRNDKWLIIKSLTPFRSSKNKVFIFFPIFNFIRKKITPSDGSKNLHSLKCGVTQPRKINESCCRHKNTLHPSVRIDTHPRTINFPKRVSPAISLTFYAERTKTR